MQIHAYLTFNGNCKKAMMFYRRCLGGELTFQTIGDSPLSEKLPKKMRHYILHATLTSDRLVLMGSDMVGDKGLIKGNGVSLSLQCTSEEEVKKLFLKLSEGGEKNHPLETNFSGALFGDLTDKFGNHWIVSGRL